MAEKEEIVYRRDENGVLKRVNLTTGRVTRVHERKPKAKPIKTTGKSGGKTLRDRYGLDYFSQIGKTGGDTTKERHPENYSTIGRRGGLRRRGKPKNNAGRKPKPQQ